MNDTSASAMPVVGEPAPPFQLPDDTNTMRDLASQRGRWLVLFFYPKDFTGGCTTEVCEFRDASTDLSAAGATTWGVSVLDTASKAAFKAKHGLNFPLLADEDHAVSERYGVWVDKGTGGEIRMGIKRATFLIDPEGRIAHAWPSVKPEGHAAAVLDELRSRTAFA